MQPPFPAKWRETKFRELSQEALLTEFKDTLEKKPSRWKSWLSPHPLPYGISSACCNQGWTEWTALVREEQERWLKCTYPFQGRRKTCLGTNRSWVNTYLVICVYMHKLKNMCACCLCVHASMPLGICVDKYMHLEVGADVGYLPGSLSTFSLRQGLSLGLDTTWFLRHWSSRLDFTFYMLEMEFCTAGTLPTEPSHQDPASLLVRELCKYPREKWVC